MKQTINFYQFREAFINFDRVSNFPDGGLSVLWDYLEQYEDDTGEEIELDVIALCCDYNQDTWEDIADNYSIDLSECEDDQERMEAVEEYLNDNTVLVGQVNDDSFIYACF